MSFIPTDLNIVGARPGSSPIPVLIDNSATVVKGGAVSIIAGVVAPVAAGAVVAGVCIGFVTADGLPVGNPYDSFGGAYTEGDWGVESYAAAADNETVDGIRALVIIDPYQVYKTTADATLGTTTGSGTIGYNADVLSGGLVLDESTTLNTTAQFVILKTDPDVTNGLYVAIKEHAIF